MITKEEILHVADLIRLEFNDDETNSLTERMSKLLTDLSIINELDTSNVEPTIHVLPINNVLREDEVLPSLDREIALKNAPSHEDGCFKVPKVIE